MQTQTQTQTQSILTCSSDQKAYHHTLPTIYICAPSDIAYYLPYLGVSRRHTLRNLFKHTHLSYSSPVVITSNSRIGKQCE